MASTVKPLYGSNNIAITCTLTSLASAAYRGSAGIDNTTNLYSGGKFQFKMKTGATVAGTPTMSVWLAESADGGTTYSDGLAAGDAVVTPTANPNLKLLYVLNCPTAATAYKSDAFYLDASGLWLMPDKFMLVFQNSTGGALDATAGNFAVWYAGYNTQIV